jgi:hypothetical protein
MRDTSGNLPPLSGVFSDYPAPIVGYATGGVRELAWFAGACRLPEGRCSNGREFVPASSRRRASPPISANCCDGAQLRKDQRPQHGELVLR